MNKEKNLTDFECVCNSGKQNEFELQIRKILEPDPEKDMEYEY